MGFPSFADFEPSEYNNLIQLQTIHAKETMISFGEYVKYLFDSILLGHFHIFMWLVISYHFGKDLVYIILWNCIANKRTRFISWYLSSYSVIVHKDLIHFALQSGQVEMVNLLRMDRHSPLVRRPSGTNLKNYFFPVKIKGLKRTVSF